MLCYFVDIYHCFGGRPICCFLYPKDWAADTSLRVLPSQPTTHHHRPQNHNHNLSSRSPLFWDKVSCIVAETLYIYVCTTFSSGLQTRRFHHNSSVYLPNNMASHNRRAQSWYPSLWYSYLMYIVKFKKFKDTSVPCILSSHPTTNTTWQQTNFWCVSRNINFTLRDVVTAFHKKCK
jgi:hypothetical protein